MVKKPAPTKKKKTPKKKKTARTPKKAAPKGRWLRIALGFLKWSSVAAIWGLVAACAVVAVLAYDLPDIDDALSVKRRASVTVLAADGTTLAAVGDLYGMPVHLKDLPVTLPQAVMAIEDRRFYDHIGIDLLGLARAMVVNVMKGRIAQGGSTITQQVAKNLFLTPARTIKRKVQEVLLALWLEQRFTKDQILTLYLNRVYLGAGTYGVDAASRKYFGKPATKVTLYESAMLAGLLKAPSRYNPLNSAEQAAKRTRVVLNAMVAAGYIKSADVKPSDKRHASASASKQRLGRYFVDWVLDQVADYTASNDQDLVVVTTVDPGLQAVAEKTMADLLQGPGAKSSVRQGALVAMATDGAVRAMVGGRDYRSSQFNRATLAERQPGSAFKPFVYLAGLESGLTPDTTLVDEAVKIGKWQPRNFDGKYRGPVTMRDALAQSLNTVAVKIAKRAGPKKIIATATRLGINATMNADLGLALGTAEVTPLVLTSAYVPFANGGIGVWGYGIEAIRSASGEILYQRAGSGPGRVIEKRYIAPMNRMLQAVIDTGTGKKARLDRPAGGKTGTSQEFRDAWFVGYTADLVTGIWLGNDDGKPMKRVTGGGLPATAWHTFMTAAHKGLPVRPLPGLEGTDGAAKDKPDAPGWFRSLLDKF